jgi:hypothetical protein
MSKSWSHIFRLRSLVSNTTGTSIAISDNGSLSRRGIFYQLKYTHQCSFKGVEMNWESLMSRNKNDFFVFQILTVLSVFFISSFAQGQPVTIDNATNTTGTMNIIHDGSDIILLKIEAFDADYDDEGELYINGQGPLALFETNNGDNNNVPGTVNILLSAEESGYFINGTNALEFRFFDDPNNLGVNDGFIINSVEIVTSLPTKNYASFDIDVDAPISSSQSLALEIYKRLVGITTPIDNPVITDMARQIARGNLAAAATIATEQPGFYNLVVRDFAARMSTRDQSINTSLNDFIATFIGLTRDDLDARLLLTGRLFYKGSDAAAVGNAIYGDILGSNNHYDDLVSDNYDLSSVLQRENTQYIRTGDNTYGVHPDAAGVITSRAFMQAHAVDGTNRRLVEYTVKQFACLDMEGWADAKAPDFRVGRDIDRFPGGEGSKYLTTCKACHSVMDGFRGAFAKYDFDRNFVQYRDGVDNKMNQNRDTFPSGYNTTDNSWVNNAVSPANQLTFGWRGVASSGNGVRQFATTIANSRAFSKCMVKRVYREICRRPVASFELPMVDSMANSFESSGYNLKNLFQELAIRPECIGKR